MVQTTTPTTPTTTIPPVNPLTGGVTYGGGATTGGGTTTGTPAATPSSIGPAGSTSTIGTGTPTPSGPQDLGINVNPPTMGSAAIGSGGENYQSQLDPAIADKVLAGGYQMPGTAAVAPRPYDEKHLVAELARELNVKGGGNLEAKVVEALAHKYGVHVPMTTVGTGHKQGALGQARHDIANWFDSTFSGSGMPAAQELHPLKGPGSKVVEPAQGPSAAGGGPAPDTSTNALHEMFQKVAVKLGIHDQQMGEKGYAEVVAHDGGQTGTAGVPGTTAGPQTAAQAWQSFLGSTIGSDGKLTANGKAWSAALVSAGKITTAQATDPQAVVGAYAGVLTEAVNSNKTTNDVLQAGAAQAPGIGQPQNEWVAYVQGVADEFGVALTPEKVNLIASQYYQQAQGAGASVQNGPSAEVDAIKNSVVALYDPNAGNNPAGVANQMFDGIKQAALQYGIPLSDQQIGTYVQKGLQGASVASMYTAKQSVIDQYKQVFQHQAQGLYPSLAPQIQAGMDVQTLIQPYNAITAAYTGKDAAALAAPGVDPTSPNYAFLQGGKDPKTGAPTMMTMDQWKQKLMQDPQYGFQHTQGAKNMASDFTSAILNEFGVVNTGQVGSSFPGQSVITSANS